MGPTISKFLEALYKLPLYVPWADILLRSIWIGLTTDTLGVEVPLAPLAKVVDGRDTIFRNPDNDNVVGGDHDYLRGQNNKMLAHKHSLALPFCHTKNSIANFVYRRGIMILSNTRKSKRREMRWSLEEACNDNKRYAALSSLFMCFAFFLLFYWIVI